MILNKGSSLKAETTDFHYVSWEIKKRFLTEVSHSNVEPKNSKSALYLKIMILSVGFSLKDETSGIHVCVIEKQRNDF